jgi:hypothetical protein
MNRANKKHDKTSASSSTKSAIPPALARAGIERYVSNLQPGDRVDISAKTFFLLFEDELMKRLTTSDDS